MIARRIVVMLACALGGCHRPAPEPRALEAPAEPPPPVVSPWVGTLAMVRAAVDSGHFAAADSVLTDFERTQAGTPEAGESAFWRAMIKADPRNPAFSPTDARSALEGYLSSESARRRNEATIMLRLLAISDSLRTALTAQRSAADAHDRAKDDELAKLRDELQRTQAELDRIKRRLGPPKP